MPLPSDKWLVLFQNLFSRRGLLILAGFFVSLYALVILVYVQIIPDIGLRSVFGTGIKASPTFRPQLNKNQTLPQRGDIVVQVGEIPIRTWADLLNAPHHVREELLQADEYPSWAKEFDLGDEQGIAVEVWFEREGSERFSYWCVLARPPVEELVPTVLWFILKYTLFLVGALVLWKRPSDNAAAQFFLLCIVTLGAYMGGYHWSHIATQPVLLIVFMVCAVMLPVVSLHFYLVFPRPKVFLAGHPRRTLMLIYGIPVGFLIGMMVLYVRLRYLVQTRGDLESILSGFEVLRRVIYVYLGVASLHYLACILALTHSYRRARDLTERNQVKWILYGAVLALFPISYSFYLAIWEPDAFGAGAATWPMFFASAFLTVAFAISITRYRLMELDKIISSGMGYFLISFLAAMLYYAIVFIATLLFNQVIAGPKLSEALMVSTTALVLMMVLDLARSRIKRALNKRLFREKSQLDLTLQRMGLAIEQLVDPVALAQRFLQSTSEFIGAIRGIIYLRHGDPVLYRLAGFLGAEPMLKELPPGSPLVESLLTGKSVVARTRGHGENPAQRQLHFLGGELAHPLVHEGKLLGMLILGPKDGPYRSEDLDLVAAFAQVTAPALQSAEGHRTIDQLNKELHAKVEKISEQQRRILALQSQLRRQIVVPPANENLEIPVEPDVAKSGIIGSSPLIRDLLGLVRKVSATDAVVLIRGESGTGKELLARALHENSPRAAKPFVKVHCAALSAGLLESELFGHVKGAFTGAHRDKIGRFELANGGTLFLDEIGDITLEVQTKLLRVLQERTFERVGSSDPIQVDVRILTATHQNLEQLIRVGRFREDLFYRLNGFPITVPPLRQRVVDIPELVLHFVRLCCQRFKKEIVQIDDDVMACMKAFPWPGNIRQLENVIERAVVIAEQPTLTLDELPPELIGEIGAESEEVFVLTEPPQPPIEGHFDLRVERERVEREHLVRALTAAAGNKAEAARGLGMARSTLVSKLKKLGLG